MIGKCQSERMRVMVGQTIACSHIGASGQNSSTRIMKVPMMWPTTKIVI